MLLPPPPLNTYRILCHKVGSQVTAMRPSQHDHLPAICHAFGNNIERCVLQKKWMRKKIIIT